MAKRLYERARLYYNTYVDAVLSDILTGRKSDLSELAGQAGAAMEEFEKYVAKTIEQTTVDVAMKPDTLEFAAGAVGGIVSALIEGALKVWEYYSKQQESYREAVVKDLKRQIEWPAWDCIIRPDV